MNSGADMSLYIQNSWTLVGQILALAGGFTVLIVVLIFALAIAFDR